MNRLKSFALGLAVAGGLYSAVVLAQTVFASLRVNGQSDLRGNIVNGAGNVTVADAFDVDVSGGADEMNITSGLVTIPGNLTVNGTCTGCGGGGGTPGGASGELQFNDGGAFGGSPELTYDPMTSIFSVGSQLIDWTLVGVTGAMNDFGSGFNFTGGQGNGTGAGGGFYVTGGEGGATGAGAPLQLWAGTGGATSGNGGSIDIRGGNSQAGDSDGGSIVITPGNGDGAGVAGTIQLDGDVSISGSCTGCGGGATTGAFTATFTTGYTVNQTMDFGYTYDADGRVNLWAETLMTGTSNSTALTTATGALPAAITPTRDIYFGGVSGSDNSVQIPVCVHFATTGQIRFLVQQTADPRCGVSAWTNSGTKVVNGGSGAAPNINWAYSLN